MSGKPRILFAARGGGNYRHLRNIIRNSDIAARSICELQRATRPWLPELGVRDIPLDSMLHVHLAKRRTDRPWLFRWAPLRFAYLQGTRFFTRWLYASWLRYLRAWRPTAVVLWNGHRLPEVAVKCAAQRLDIPVIHIENGVLPNTRTVDPKGVNAWNSVPRDPEFFRSRNAKADDSWQLVARELHRTKSVDDVRDTPLIADQSLPERYVFVPFQVDSDTQILVHSPHVGSMRELFDMLESAIQQMNDKDLMVVFKEHPTSYYRYPDLHDRCARNPRLQFANTRSTQELIENSETVVTINSTVGIEALLFRKRVVTLGEAFYNIESLVKHATNASELAHVLADRDWCPDERVASGLIDWLKTEYCVPRDPARTGEDDWQAMADRILKLSGTTQAG